MNKKDLVAGTALTVSIIAILLTLANRPSESRIKEEVRQEVSRKETEFVSSVSEGINRFRNDFGLPSVKLRTLSDAARSISEAVDTLSIPTSAPTSQPGS